MSPDFQPTPQTVKLSISVASTKPVSAQDNAVSENGSKDLSRALFLESQQRVEKEAVIDKLSSKSPERKLHPKSSVCSHDSPAMKTPDAKKPTAETVTVLQTKLSLIHGGLLSCSTNAPVLFEADKPTRKDPNVLQVNPGLTNSALLSRSVASSSFSYTHADNEIEAIAGSRTEFETSIVDEADTLHNESSESNDFDPDEGKAAAPSEYQDVEGEDFEVEFETDDIPLIEDLSEATVVLHNESSESNWIEPDKGKAAAPSEYQDDEDEDFEVEFETDDISLIEDLSEATVVVLPPKRRSRMLKVSLIASSVFILHQITHIKFELTSACLAI